MKSLKINKSNIIKYVLIFFACLIFSLASVADLNPFLFAFFFACLFVGLDEKIISVFTVLTALLVNSTLQGLLTAITVVACGLIIFYSHKLLKRNLNLITICLSYLVGLITFFYYNFNNLTFLTYYTVLGLISLFVFIVVLQVLLLRNNFFKLTIDESICFLFFLAILGLGVGTVYILNFSIFRLVVMFVVLLCVGVGSPSLTYIITMSLTFGCALKDFSLIIVAEFVVVAMLANMFSMPHKIRISFAAIVSDICLQYFFINQSIGLFYNILPIVLACLLFVFIPNKQLNNLSDILYVKKSEMSSRSAINVTRKNLRKRMLELSNVFMDMKQIHLNMVKKELTKEELSKMLAREVLCTCCRDCLDKNRCTRALGTDNKSNLDSIIDIALRKGKVTLLDIPPSLSNRCAKINNLISLLNRLSDEYKQYKNIMADVNNVKILLADQMGAVSNLLLNIGDEIDSNIKFDIATENKIIAKLLNKNIYCKEVLLYTEKNGEITAVVIVKGNNSSLPIIEKVISEVLKISMSISKVMPVEESDFNSVTLVKRSKYDCVFGLSSCNKSGESECGDCHSIIRLGKNKFLLALCDGMGAGKNAHKMSAITLGLIENFYKVGFDNEIILESVNKLLAINNQENYSTLDVCVIDLEKNIADFIKVGSPYGIIKRENNIEIVEGGALPIGALENITPATYKTTISIRDIIVMVTDGITDAFETEDALIDYVSKLATNNPQTIADSILNEALSINEMSAKDDMTVLVARTYLKN